jgi:hypothetical protein
MAKRKQSRSRRYGKRFKRKASKAKIPFEVLIAGGSIPFTPAASGISSIFDSAQNGDFVGVADALKVGFLGMKPARNTSEFDLMAAINPFNFESARYTKMLIYAGLIGSIRRKISGRYTNKLFAKIPLLGRWVS